MATKSSSFMAMAGNMPATVATRPVKNVTLARETLGMIAWKARPAR